MDAELYKVFLKQAQRGENIRRLMQMEEWKSVEQLIDYLIADNDTVKGIQTDKEWWKRQAKVNILEELKGQLQSLRDEARSAMSELTNDEAE